MRRPRASLLRDQRGAIMVIGAFMSIFLTAVLYHVVGVGRSILYRQRMQDHADRAAFEGALGYARSMNEIGLANNVQMIAVANFWALLEAKRNIASCVVGSPFGGTPQNLCPPLQDPVDAAYDRAAPDLLRLIAQTADAGEALRDTAPALAQEEIAAMAPGPPEGERTLIAARLVEAPMPLRTGPMEVQCVRAGPFVEPLLLESIIPDVLVLFFQRPSRVLERAPPLCPRSELPWRGPQVMDPPNRSGSEGLQIRAIVIGREQTETTPVREHGVRLAERTIRLGEEAPVLDRGRQRLRRIGLAQAEYFSAWTDANSLASDRRDAPGVMPEENTFYMHWRARLRRLRVPVEVDVAESDAAFADFVRGPLGFTCREACSGGADCGDTCQGISDLAGVGNNALQ
jgi:hypothetical protein